MLGQIALESKDVPLARGHFGTGYRIGAAALKKAGRPRPMPYARIANQDFFECGKGLIYCLKNLGKRKMAAEVVEQLLRCDPSDPLGVGRLLVD